MLDPLVPRPAIVVTGTPGSCPSGAILWAPSGSSILHTLRDWAGIQRLGAPHELLVGRGEAPLATLAWLQRAQPLLYRLFLLCADI